MSIQFPDAPAQGDSFVATNGVSYTYDNGGWIANSQSALDNRYVNLNGDTMTGDLTVPNLVATGDIQSTSQNGGPLAGFRNQLINGNYVIAQRYTGYPFTATGVQANSNPALLFGPDRWGTSQDREFQSRNERPSNAFVGSIQWRTGTQTNANWSQVIELIADGSAGPRNNFLLTCDTWTVSHWIFAADRNNFVCDVDYVNAGYSPSVSGTIANIADGDWQILETVGDWIRVSASFSMTGVADAPAGALGVRVQFRNDGNMRAVGSQFEPGPVATPFEHRPIGLETSLCHRYYLNLDRVFLNWAATSDNASTGRYSQYVVFPTTMRVPPTYSDSGSHNNISGTPAGSTTTTRVYIDAVTRNTSNSTNVGRVNGVTLDAEL